MFKFDVIKNSKIYSMELEFVKFNKYYIIWLVYIGIIGVLNIYVRIKRLKIILFWFWFFLKKLKYMENFFLVWKMLIFIEFDYNIYLF